MPASLADALPAGFEPQVALLSDLDDQGRFTSAWLGANADRVVALSPDGRPLQIAMADISEVRIDELFGASRLVAVVGDVDHILARYSRNLVAEFGVFARCLDDLRDGRPVVLPNELESATCLTCGAPLPERGGTCSQCVSRSTMVRRLLTLLAPYPGQVIAIIAWAGLGVGTQMVPPLTFKMIADRVIDAGHHDELIYWIGLMALTYVVGAASQYMTSWSTAWLGSRLVADMRLVLHARTQRLRLQYHQRHESGALIGRVMGDTRSLQGFLTDGVPFFLINLLSFVVIGIILVVLDWRLALLVFLPVPVLVFGGARFWSILRPLFHRYGHRSDRLHTVLSESIHGVTSVKSLVQETRRDTEFGRANEQLFGIDINLERTFQGFFGSMSLMMALGTVLVWYVGGLAIIAEQPGVSLGTLLAFVGYMGLFYGPLQWFSLELHRATTALTAAERIFAVLDQPEEGPPAGAAAAPVPRVAGNIRLEGVRFSYERGREVLKGIDLEIRAGEMIGLVGKSGAGKSTIINLIARFHTPDSGKILVDDIDLDTVDLSSWRSQVGMVMQAPFLFNGSILENIRYGAPNASFEAVVAAARAANAHDFIAAKEDGYDTVVGDGGGSLSGGERQRVAIARAILNDPRVLILDEATSAVDSETEKQIQEAIAHLVKGRTTLAIAHRLATLRNADRLVVIDEGKIIEQGTHDELMALEAGHFAKLVRLQTDINRLRSEQMAWDES